MTFTSCQALGTRLRNIENGGTASGFDEFSVFHVLPDTTVVIKQNREMLVSQFIAVEGTLEVDGILTVIQENQPTYGMNFDFIGSRQSLEIPVNMQMLIDHSLTNFGTLTVAGRLVVL